MIQTVAARHLDARFPLVGILPVADLPSLAHLTRLTVTSWSMFPALLKGDVIEVGPPDRVLPGDIVVFRRAELLVCHRVTALGRDGEVYTRGDGAGTSDAPIPRQDVLAKVTTVFRGGRPASPAPLPRPPLASRVRMKADVAWTAARTRALAAALASLASLKRVRWIRAALGAALVRLVRISVGVRTPLQSIEAYQFVPLVGVPRGRGTVSPFASRPPGELIFMASIGPYPLAALDGVTGALHIRRTAAGLGLEERLRAHVGAAAASGSVTEDAKPEL
jgi:hypothetical protein